MRDKDLPRGRKRMKGEEGEGKRREGEEGEEGRKGIGGEMREKGGGE